MILDAKKTNLAYRCPRCGHMVFSVVGIFSLTGDMIKLKCGECGQSELTAVYTPDRKVKMTVPCFICPDPHVFTISVSGFFKGDLMRLACPYSGVDICLVGDAPVVWEAAKKADKEFVQLLKEAGVEDFGDFVEAKEMDDHVHSETIADPEYQSAVHLTLCELEAEGNISCKCGRACGKYEFKFVGSKLDSLLIYCEKCSAATSLPITDRMALEEFVTIDKITLT